MDFGITNKVNELVWGNLFQQNHVTDKTDNTSFSSVLAAIRADNINNQDLEGMVLDGEISSSSIEEILKQKYPQLSYHVSDASKFTYWNRLDFPFSEVFKENMDENKLKNWKPTTPYATGYEDYVQRDRLSIPQGAYSVIIHPDVQKRMEMDSTYAQKILDKIDKHFQDTIRINEAIDPGCTIGMKQAVYIDESGEIGHQVSIGNGPDYHAGEKENTVDKIDGRLPQNKKYVHNQTVINNILQNMKQNPIAHSSNYEDLVSLAGLGIIPYIIDKKKE